MEESADISVIINSVLKKEEHILTKARQFQLCPTANPLNTTILYTLSHRGFWAAWLILKFLEKMTCKDKNNNIWNVHHEDRRSFNFNATSLHFKEALPFWCRANKTINQVAYLPTQSLLRCSIALMLFWDHFVSY